MKKKRSKGFEIIAFAWWILAFGIVASFAYTILGDRNRVVRQDVSRFQRDLQTRHRQSNLGGLTPQSAHLKSEFKVSRSPRKFYSDERQGRRHYRKPRKRSHRAEADFRSPLTARP